MAIKHNAITNTYNGLFFVDKASCQTKQQSKNTDIS